MLEWLLVFAALGALVGFVAGLLGVGGGGIMVPALTSIFLMQGVNTTQVVHLALGTSMACIVFTSIASLRAHHKNSAIIWPIVSRMSAGVIVGTFLATFVAALISSLYLAIFFSVFMGFVAYQAYFKKPNNDISQPPSSLNLVVSGSGIGAVSALVSIGGGSLTVPYLTAKNIDIRKAIGTSAAIGLPISLAGTAGYLLHGINVNYGIDWVYGFIYLPAVIIIATVSFFTAPLGAKLAHSLPITLLKKFFALLLAILSIKMLVSVV